MVLDSLLTRLALLLIRAYQRYLSPVKGFSCALRVATGGASCSAYGYRVIERHGVPAGLSLLRRRLRQCGDVHRQALASRNQRLGHQGGFCEPSCDCDLPCCLDFISWDLDFRKNKKEDERQMRAGIARGKAVAASAKRWREEEERP